jgi:NTE family protein
LNHFPTDILQGQCETVIGVYVSPIQKNLSSIKAVTTRAFDILSANSNVQNLIFATGLLNQKIYAYTAHRDHKTKMLF